VATILGICIVAGLIWFCVRRKHRKLSDESIVPELQQREKEDVSKCYATNQATTLDLPEALFELDAFSQASELDLSDSEVAVCSTAQAIKIATPKMLQIGDREAEQALYAKRGPYAAQPVTEP
jgi:hypothetical protein